MKILLLLFVSLEAFAFIPHSGRKSISFRTARMCQTSGSTEQSLKVRLAADMKEAMKSKQKVRLAAVRAIQTAIKQKEVDERIEVTDDLAIDIMAKMVKQRRESIKSYADAGRTDLVEQEEGELKEIQSYMPQQASAEEIEAIIVESIFRLEAKTIKDMGKVMADVKPRLTGRADMAALGAVIKKKLS